MKCPCVATVKECVQNLSQEDDKENLVASLWGAERCLRVLESVSTAALTLHESISRLKCLIFCPFSEQVTVQNPENQGYLIAYKDSQLIISSAK